MNDLLKLAVGTHSLGWTLIYAFFLLFVLVRSEPLVRNFWIAEIFQFLISFAEVRDEIVYVFERHSPKRILMAVFRTQKQSTLQPFLPLAADARPPQLSFDPSEWRSRLRVLVLALVDLERKNRRGHAAQPASQIWFTVSQGILDNWTKSETGKGRISPFRSEVGRWLEQIP